MSTKSGSAFVLSWYKRQNRCFCVLSCDLLQNACRHSRDFLKGLSFALRDRVTGQRQLDRKARHLAAASGFNGTAVFLDNLPGNGQTQSGPFGPSSRIDAVKGIEYMFEPVRGMESP